jgi:signal transduction histidine kinase
MWAEKVQAESRKYRALFEGSADMLLIVDPRTFAVREGNAPAREQLGAPATVEALLEEPQRASFVEALRRAAASGSEPEALPDLGLSASGARRLVADARFAPIAIAGEALVLVSLHDRTRQRAMERELAVRERLSSIGLFTAGLAHEINNPLEGMGNYLALLEQDELPPENRRRYLALVQHGFGRIRDLVRDLLRFARPENSSTRIDLGQVVSNASKLVALSSSLKQVVIETQGLEQPLWLFGDAGRLEQVLVNLLLNAGKAQQGQGRIVVRARTLPAESALELAVEDGGPGIPAESLSRIFDPFFGSGEGTGLGLAVSYGIVRAHGGTISAENRPEGGARFVVRLPRNLPETSP